MRNVPTPEQTEIVSRIMPRVHRLCVDKTGMGLPIFETMAKAHYGKVEGITFTQQTKETMATQLKRRLEEKRCRLPEPVVVNGKSHDQIVWQSFRSVRKTSTALGQVRFDAGREYDHGDLFWSKCLAEAAASQPTEHGLIALWREQVEEIKARPAATTGPSDVCRDLAQAQFRSVQSGIFGADRWLVDGAPRPTRRAEPTPLSLTACPKCGCTALSRYGDLAQCNPCGWKNR